MRYRIRIQAGYRFNTRGIKIHARGGLLIYSHEMMNLSLEQVRAALQQR